jgi:hypothetical protein
LATALVSSTLLIACSDDTGDGASDPAMSAVPDTGAASGGAPASDGDVQSDDIVDAALACLGVGASRLVSDLTDAEVEQACRGARRCDPLNKSTDETWCVALAAVAGSQVTADIRKATCEKKYYDCTAMPDVELGPLRAAAQALLEAPCGESEGCEATVGQLARCVADLSQASADAYPTCENLKADIEVGKGELPTTCAEIGDACLAMLYPISVP